MAPSRRRHRPGGKANLPQPPGGEFDAGSGVDAVIQQAEPEPELVAWTPNGEVIDYLVDARRLERFDANPQFAERLIADARRHLALTASVVARGEHRDDPAGAFSLCYDAARKSLAAILAAQGLRARGGDGGHAVLFDAVRGQFPGASDTLLRFDWLRQTRNDAQYPGPETPSVSEDDVNTALPAAVQIVDLAAQFVRDHRP